jgi:DNA-binding transcriptional LysR family regulator
MRIDFLGLQAFLSIAERGSFQRAAAHLNLSQTAVSHRMRKLEDELGVKLLARTTREVTLTRAGIDLLPRAQKAVAELEQSFDELMQQGAKRRERLDIACLPAFAVHYLPPILARFRTAQPALEIRIFEMPSAAVAELVQSGEVEFGLSVVQTGRWDLDVETVATEPLTLACPAEHPLARQNGVAWADLANLPLIRVSPKAAIRAITDDTASAAGLTLNWQYEVQHVETAVRLVEEGLGFAIVPRIDVVLHRGRALTAIPLGAPPVTCDYGLVTRRGMPLSEPAAALRDLLVDQLRHDAA